MARGSIGSSSRVLATLIICVTAAVARRSHPAAPPPSPVPPPSLLPSTGRSRRCWNGDVAALEKLIGSAICDSGANWLEVMTQRMAASSRSLVYINIGANKGYNIAEITRMWGGMNISNAEWYEEMQHFMKASGYSHHPNAKANHGYLCGACELCKKEVPALLSREVAVHAFEIEPRLVQWLRWACARFGVRAAIEHAMGGETSGVGSMAYNPDVHFGWEAFSASEDNATRMWYHTHPVRAVALDDYLAQENIAHAHLVSIDAERHDGHVLRGMRSALRTRAVELVDFEYTETRNMAKPHPGETRIETTLALMDEVGYGCFWVVRDQLVPLSDGCHVAWLHAWRQTRSLMQGNIVCSHGVMLDELWTLAGERALRVR